MEHTKRVLKLIASWFDSVDWYNVRFIPEGAYDPLPPIPNEVEITPKDVDDAINWFDEQFPDYAGMLRAEVRGKKEY